MRTLGEYVRHRRREAGLTRHQLARRAGVRYSYVYQIEGNRAGLPRGHQLRALAAVLAPSPEDAPGWERLAPLAQHMAEKRLVRSRGDAGASLRHLDREVLREALTQMLSQDDDDGYLVYQLVVEGREPALVAAEWGVSRAVLVEQLRDAVESLACRYENVANARLTVSPAKRARATLVRKRG
jgi:transcriptional regulator with XRE-family HTH domain